MNKRSLAKSGSSVGGPSLTPTSGSNLYQQSGSLSSCPITQQYNNHSPITGKQFSSGDSSNIYSLLQASEVKRNKPISSSAASSRQNSQTTGISPSPINSNCLNSASSTMYSNVQQQLIRPTSQTASTWNPSAKPLQNTHGYSSPSPSQLPIPNYMSSHSSLHSRLLNSSSNNGKIPTITTATATMNTSTQPQQSLSNSFIYNSNMQMQRSPSNQLINPSDTPYRTQTTPTSLKNSQKLQLPSQVPLKTYTNTAASSAFHSQRPSLATTNASPAYKENMPGQNRRPESKPEVLRKTNQDTNQLHRQSITDSSNISAATTISVTSPSSYPINLLKDLNSSKPSSAIARINRPSGGQASQLISKDIQSLKSTTNSNSLSNLSIGDTSSLSRSPARSSEHQTNIPTKNLLSHVLYTNQHSNSIIPSATTVQSSVYLTDTDRQFVHSDSSIVSNISQLNISDRGAAIIDPVTHQIECQLTGITSNTYQAQPPCSNHPYKKGKYIIFNSTTSNNLYCSKCAVELSKKGFQTIHIADYAIQQQQQKVHDQNDEVQNEYLQEQNTLMSHSYASQHGSQNDISQEQGTAIKLKEINYFFENIDQLGSKWQELNHALLVKKKDVSSFYERQEQRVESQFEQYIELLQSMRERTLMQVRGSREKSVAAYQQWEKETKERLTDFINIKADIEMNTDKIVNQIQMDDFNRIMSSYKDKLDRMTIFFSSMANQCLELVKFDTHSPSAATFAPHIASSFNILNFTTTLVKKRVSEFVKSPQQNSTQGYQSSTPSPHSKSGRINTPAQGVDTYSSNGISTRGSIGQSLHFGSVRQHTNTAVTQPTQITAISEYDDASGEEYYFYGNDTNNSYIHGNNNSHNHNHTANSPDKNEKDQRQDMLKKDVYMSFGNNKDQQLQKAIQQAKSSHQGQLTSQPSSLQSSVSQPSIQQQTYAESILNQTPSQHNGAYVNQIQPLTDIMENSNINDDEEEEDTSKQQPNTPELKQVEIKTAHHTVLQQAGAFRTLFGEEDTTSKNQQDKINPLVQYNSAPLNGCTVYTSDQRRSSQLQQTNGIRSPQTSIGIPAVSKSPRYSMYECEETDSAMTYEYPKVSSTNNQLDEYIQMLERQNGPDSSQIGGQFSYVKSQYVQPSTTQKQMIAETEKYSLYQQKQEDELVVNQKNEDENDHPLFSSPSNNKLV